MEADHIPGLSVGFYKDDFVWTKGFGYADLENKVLATERSSYRLASNTKSMTAVAIVQLVEKGKIDLDRDIRDYIPYFPGKKWPFTTRQLLGHLAGISHYRDYEKEGHIKVYKDTRESLDIFDYFELIAEPGTRYNYSSYGYNLLGAIVEVAAKEPFGDYLQRHLWEPLGMDDTYMDSPAKIIPDRVKGYRLVFGELQNSEYVNMSSRFAAGGTRSTVVDLLKYAKGYQDTNILSQSSIDMMESSMSTKNGYFTDYGMGWRLTPVNGHFIAMHTGSQQETRTILIRIPAEDAAIAIAYNFEGGNLRSYAYRLFQLLFEEQWNQPVYHGSKENEAIYRAIWDVFNFGLGYYDRYPNQNIQDTEKLQAAFAYFNTAVHTDSIHSSFENTSKRIRDGRHPFSDEAFVKMGVFMRQKLTQKDKNKNYHQEGAIPFFYDYINLYKADPNISANLRFSSEFEGMIQKWENDWEQVWTAEMRTLKLTAWSDPIITIKKLKKQFYDKSIYPDFSSDLSETIRYLYLSNKTNESIETARLVQQIYPKYAFSYLLLANAYVIEGDFSKAKENYKLAQQLRSESNKFSANSLTGFAGRLIMMNKLDKAMDVLQIAGEFFPEASKIPELIGEIYLEKSRRSFEKALKLKPESKNPWKKLKKIQ